MDCRCGMMGGLLVLALAGCDRLTDLPPEPEPDLPAPTALAERFDAARCGTIIGRVTWPGAMPTYPPITIGTPRPEGGVQYQDYPNPNAPQIEPATRGVRGAVVALERADPVRSRSWDHGPVRVELHDEQIRIFQGNASRQIGFVRRGDEIEMVSRQPVFHALTVRGAAFFALMFPDPDQPLRRRLSETGLVELTSGAGKYWHQAYLFVSEHPYLTLTDPAGHFTLANVPTGEYRLRCWLPNAQFLRTERDPNMGSIIRQKYAPPFDQIQNVSVIEGRETQAHFSVAQK